MIEDARLVFRNFAGAEGPYNREGDRNFCVLLDPETAENMLRDGWNIKFLKSREEGEIDQPYIQVTVGFGKGRPPKLVMITSKGRTDLGEDECEIFDWCDISVADLIIRPYNWSVGGRGGVKAYLKSLFLTVREDELDLKYADVEYVQARGGRTDDSDLEHPGQVSTVQDDEPPF